MHWLRAAGMPWRIPDYPDAYIYSIKGGSYISAASFVSFLFLLFEALYSSRESATAHN